MCYINILKYIAEFWKEMSKSFQEPKIERYSELKP